MVLVDLFLLHGMAAAIGLSNCLIAFLSFIVILVIKIDKVNSSRSSSFVEFVLLVCPSLFFSLLSSFPNLGPNFGPHNVCSSGRLNFCQSLLDHTYPFGEEEGWRGAG